MSNNQAQNTIESIKVILSDIRNPHPCLELKRIFEGKIHKYGNDVCASNRYRSGHFTGSAILLSVDHKETLLIYHPSFEKWIQPGGHIEKGESLEDTILRETEEETGFPRGCLRFIKEEDRYVSFLHTFDVPENPKKNRPLHQHFNICLFLTYNQETTAAEISVSTERLPTKWFSLSNIDQIDTDEATKDLLRFIVSRL